MASRVIAASLGRRMRAVCVLCPHAASDDLGDRTLLIVHLHMPVGKNGLRRQWPPASPSWLQGRTDSCYACRFPTCRASFITASRRTIDEAIAERGRVLAFAADRLVGRIRGRTVPDRRTIDALRAKRLNSALADTRHNAVAYRRCGILERSAADPLFPGHSVSGWARPAVEAGVAGDLSDAEGDELRRHQRLRPPSPRASISRSATGSISK